VSAFWLANRSSNPNMGSVLHYCANFLCDPSTLPPKKSSRRIKLSRNHSLSPVSGLLIAVCSALRYILNFRYESGEFCDLDIFIMRSFVEFPGNYTYCRLRMQHRVLQHHIVLLRQCCCTWRLSLLQRSDAWYSLVAVNCLGIFRR